jgi:O-acetyl-ADP-ribose deacetylase (regulator of RNase III)
MMRQGQGAGLSSATLALVVLRGEICHRQTSLIVWHGLMNSTNTVHSPTDVVLRLNIRPRDVQRTGHPRLQEMSSILTRIAVVEGDITRQAVDAIVNAANATLLGGGGVDGAIHRAAGPELLQECRTLNGCATGQAKVTKGYRLSAKWVIHTVGPIWRDGKHQEDELLASCYRSCFALAKSHGIKTIAFPSISTGAYGFPMDRAARIAVSETKCFLEKDDSVKKVILVCFGANALEIHAEAVEELID